MERTAVTRLLEYFIDQKDNGATHWSIQDLIAQLYQAKELEKEQIEESFLACWKANVPDGIECKLSANEYYNKTFKSE